MQKTIAIFLLCLSAFTLFSCKKDIHDPTILPPTPDNYASAGAFFAQNASPLQTVTVNGVTGGSFTTPKGTKVTVPSNSFQTPAGVPVSGNVTITFKDVYKKSDMVLNGLSTNSFSSGPIKSGGMFFIKATDGTTALELAPGKKITVEQPFNGWAGDAGMIAMVLQDGGAAPNGWIPAPMDSIGGIQDSVALTAVNYVFSMYEFNSPLDSGSWCNSDNPSYFSAYPQTTLTLHPTNDPAEFDMEVFLLFTPVNSMVHVYGTVTDFPYEYAPVGLACTVVVLGVKEGTVYSSFTPIVISTDQLVNFTLSETTTDEFKAALDALN